MNPQNTDNAPSSEESSTSSSGNLAAESPTMTQATSTKVSINDILNSEYNTVLPTNAPVKRFIRKITHIDPKKLQQAGLDRKIAEAIHEQKLNMATRQPSQPTASSYKKVALSTSSVIKSNQTATLPTSTTPCSSSTVIQSTLPPPPSPIASKPLTTNSIIPPKITITAPETLNETDRHPMDGLSPQQRLQQVKHMLNQKLLLKKFSHQHDLSVHLQPPPLLVPKPKKLPILITVANTQPQPQSQPPKGFIHLIEPREENTPNKPVTKKRTLQKSPQDIARQLDFPSEAENPNLIQYVRKNPMKFLNKNDNHPSYAHSNKLPESIDDIPKASIKPANQNLYHNKTQSIHGRQMVDYPEVSPLKIQFTTVNIPLEAPLPTIDTIKTPYPMSDSNYYRMHNETQSHSGSTTTEFITENNETALASQQNNDNDNNVTLSASPNCLIVLENKILSQDEMIDLTALRLSTSSTPQRFARPHKPIPEVVIKQEKLDDFPTTTANTSALQKDLICQSKATLTSEFVHLPAKRNKKVIVNAQKLKLPQEKIAELAKKIAQSTTTKTKAPKQTKQTNKVSLLDIHTQVKLEKSSEMRLLNIKPIYKRNSLTDDKMTEKTNLQRKQVSLDLQSSTITTERNFPTRFINETQTSISTTNLFQHPIQEKKQIVIVKQEPKTPQILPPKELPDNRNAAIIPLPPHGLQKVSIQTQKKNISSTQFNSSFTGNRKSAVDIVDEPSDTEDSFSAVDFLAAFVDTNPITEETTLELSPEELNLSASCAMNLSPLRIASYLPCKRRVSTTQRQLTIPTSSSQYITNNSSAEIGKIVALQDVNTLNIDTQNVSFSMENSQTMSTILIQSSNGPETIITKAAEKKCPLITIPANKLKPVKILNALDTTKMGTAKLRDMEVTKNFALKVFTHISQDSTNKVKSNEVENIIVKKSDILEESKKHGDSIVVKTDTNLLNKKIIKTTGETNTTPVKLLKIMKISEEVSAKQIGTEYSNEVEKEYVKPSELNTKADDSMKKNILAKVSNEISEKTVTLMDQSDFTESLELSNNTPEKSTEMPVKTPVMSLEKSNKTPVKSTNKSDENIAQKNLSYNTTESFSEITVKPIEKSIKSTDKSVENILKQVKPIQFVKNVVLESGENKDSNPTEPVDINDTTKGNDAKNNLSPKSLDIESFKDKLNDLGASQCADYSKSTTSPQNEIVTPNVENTNRNTTSKDVAQNNNSTKTSEQSPIKSPEKYLNLKSILKLTLPSNAAQQNCLETSDTSPELNIKKSTEILAKEGSETTKSDELKFIHDNEPSKTNESNSNNTGPSKRISRFKKGKINLVVRNKPGAVTKNATATSLEIKIGKEDKSNKEDKLEQDGYLSESSNTKKSECVTEKVVVEASKEDQVQIGDTLSESSSIRKSECVIREIDVVNENKVNTEDKVEKTCSVKESTTKITIERAAKLMEEKTISEEIKTSDRSIIIEGQINETSKDNNIRVFGKDYDKPEPQSIDLQCQVDKPNDLKTAVSLQNATVIDNVDDNASSHLNLNTTEVGRQERETESKKAEIENKDYDLNTDKAATSVSDIVAAEKPSKSVELFTKDVQGKELIQTSKQIGTPNDISYSLKQPKMSKRKSEAENSDDLLPPDSAQVLEELRQANVSLVNIVKHSSIDKSPNLPNIPFKRKNSETIQKNEEEAPKGIKTLLKIKKSTEIDGKNLENEKKKPKESESNLLRSNETKESTFITSTQVKQSKTNENKFEGDVCPVEPISSGKEVKRRVGRPSLQKTDTSIVKVNENFKNPESSLMGRRSLRFSLNSKSETITSTAPLPPKTKHSHRHQMSDDDLEFLPVNAEIKEFRVTKTRKSLNDNSNIKEKIDCPSEKTKRIRLASKPMDTEDSVETVLTKPNVSEVAKRTRLSSKSMEADVKNQDKQNVAVLTPTVTLTKRTRFSSQSSGTEAKNEIDSSCNNLLTHTPFALMKRTSLASKPTDPEDSCQDSSHNIKTSHTKQRKKLRKTLEDIKKSSQKPHPDTDSDDDYRNFDLMNGLEDDNEFLGFDENSEKSSKPQKSNEQANAENISKITSTTKAKGGTLKNWLITGKAISPTFIKDPPVSRRHDDKITRGIPLKKRWDIATNLNEETDITDDTSPADDDDERDSVRGLKTVIDSNTALLGSKKIKLNKTMDRNHTFLEPRPVATKSNVGTDSDRQVLSTHRQSKRSISFKKDTNIAQVSETYKSLDIPATQTLKTQENSKEIYDSTSKGDNSKTKAQAENSRITENCKVILVKERAIEDLLCNRNSNKQNKSITMKSTEKTTEKKVSFEDIQKMTTTQVQSNVSTEDESNKTQNSSTKCRSSNAKSNKRLNSRISLDKTQDIGPTAQSDLSTEDESNKTQDSSTKFRSSNVKSKKRLSSRVSLEKTQDIGPSAQSDFSTEDVLNTTQNSFSKCKNLKERNNNQDNSKNVSDLNTTDDSNNDNSSRSRNKKRLHNAIVTAEDALNIATPSQFEKSQIKKTTTSENSQKFSMEHKEISAKDKEAPENLQTPETLSKPTKAIIKEKNALLNRDHLETKLNKSSLKINDSEEECSPQIHKKRGRKRKILKMEDSSEDDSTTVNQSSTNSGSLSSLKPITTPHLAIIKQDSSMEISTPSKKRKPSNMDTTAVSFNPRLLLITKREQIDSDEVLTETNPGAGPIQCGLCLRRTTSGKWTLHLAEHYGVGWQVGKQKLNVANRNTVFTTITSYFKTTEIKGLSCRMCKKLYRSALGLITHLESCGTPALRLVCEYCKKDYTKLTMPIHQRSCAERSKLEKSLSEKVMTSEEPQEEVFTNTGRLKRHSTIKAESKLKVIGAELQQNTEQTEFQPKDHMRFVPPLDKEEVHTKWQQDLEKFGKGFCPKKICKFNSPHNAELEKHIQQCKLIKTGYFCNFCRRACFETEQVALEHISKNHGPGKEDSNDSDCDVKTDAEQSSDDDNDLSEGVNEDETENEATDNDDVGDEEKNRSQTRRVKKKVISNNNRSQNTEAISYANRKRVYDTRALDVNKEVIGKWKNFLSSNYSSEALFPHLTSHYSIIKNQDFAKYLPSQVSSMKFSLENKYKLNATVGEPNPNVEWKELKRFETLDNKSEIFYFLGAPVKFCTWIPLPNDIEEQYILVGYRKEMFNFVKFSQPKPHHTVLIIFKVTQEKKLPKLELHYGFVVKDGPVHGVQFLPSGGYNAKTNRLGLMAVATITSAIKVYSLPIELEIEECDKIENLALIDITASFELNIDVLHQGQTDHVVMKPQCLEICWSEFAGHNHIFASFSNGFVGIWDITDDPQENLNRFILENVVCYAALNYFYIGEKGSNCLAVHYDTNGPRWLAISAKYRKFVVYDIHNFMQPFIIKEECNKNILRCLNWSPVWGPMLAGYCDSIPNNGRSIYSISANNILFSQQRFENMVSAVTYIHYSPVTNLLVSTADNGDILFGDPREFHYEYGLGKKFAVPRRILSAMDVKQLDHEAIVRPPLKQSKTDIKLPSDWTVHESNYKDKYGLVFNPLIKLKEENKTKYYNCNRRAPINITPLMRINTLRCNLNMSAKRLVAVGYENGFMRIIYFNKDVQFGNWK